MNGCGPKVVGSGWRGACLERLATWYVANLAGQAHDDCDKCLTSQVRRGRRGRTANRALSSIKVAEVVGGGQEAGGGRGVATRCNKQACCGTQGG